MFISWKKDIPSDYTKIQKTTTAITKPLSTMHRILINKVWKISNKYKKVKTIVGSVWLVCVESIKLKYKIKWRMWVIRI